jgi:hypothetical protein
MVEMSKVIRGQGAGDEWPWEWRGLPVAVGLESFLERKD